MAEPHITRTDSGHLTLTWPEVCGPSTVIAREVLVDIVASLNELNEMRLAAALLPRSLWPWSPPGGVAYPSEQEPT